jgi:hypothetical protein
MFAARVSSVQLQSKSAKKNGSSIIQFSQLADANAQVLKEYIEKLQVRHFPLSFPFLCSLAHTLQKKKQEIMTEKGLEVPAEPVIQPLIPSGTPLKKPPTKAPASPVSKPKFP